MSPPRQTKTPKFNLFRRRHRRVNRMTLTGFSVLCAMSGACSTSAFPGSDGGDVVVQGDLSQVDASAPGTDGAQAPDAAVALDRGDDGNTLATCGDEFMLMTFTPAGSTSGAVCLPLPDGVTMTTQGCTPREVSVNLSDAASVFLSLSGAPDMFSREGSVPVALSLSGRGLPCAAAAVACDFRTIGPMCFASVVRRGGVGQTVEAVLRDPCSLQQLDSTGRPVATLTIRTMRIRGTLRLYLDASTSHDAGSSRPDCGTP